MGSGKYWKLHLAKHGEDVHTEILRECKDYDEVKEWGLYYSNLWNIVESDEWANLKPETGDGGPMPQYLVEQAAAKRRGQKRTPEQNAAKSKRQNGTKKSQQWLDKRIGSKYNRHIDYENWDFLGEKHWNYHKTLYEFVNITTGEKVIATKNAFGKMVPGANPARLINGERKTSKGWRYVGIAASQSGCILSA